MTLFTLLAAITLRPQMIEADKLPSVPEKPLSVQEMIVKYAEIYAAKEQELNLVINDESGFSCTPKGSNDRGLAFGPAQYHLGTFIRYSKMKGEELDYHSCNDQIKLMAWQFANIPKSKCEWTKWKHLYCNK